jgi:hypothetical protein
MPEPSAHFEPVAWWFTRKEIGRGLREHYPLAEDSPARLLLLIKKLDGTPEISNQDSAVDKARTQSALTTGRDDRLKGSALHWHCNGPRWFETILP